MLLEIAQLQLQIDFVNDFHALALPGGRKSQLPPPLGLDSNNNYWISSLAALAFGKKMSHFSFYDKRLTP